MEFCAKNVFKCIQNLYFSYQYTIPIVKTRNFPQDIYKAQNTSTTTNGTTEAKDYGFLIALLPSGLLLILLILLFICTRNDVCLVKTWIK